MFTIKRYLSINVSSIDKRVFSLYFRGMITGEVYNRIKEFKERKGRVYPAEYLRIFNSPEVVNHCEAYLDQGGALYTHDNNAYLKLLRFFCLNDLFFISNFVLGADFNDEKGYFLQKIKELEAHDRLFAENKIDNFHYIWARGHGKSSLITECGTFKYHLNNPSESSLILSFKKSNASKFLSTVADMYKKEEIRHAFQDILWENVGESGCWSVEEKGILLKRKSSRREKTIETAGLLEGMPTGSHFNRLVFDDIETDDIAENTAQLQKCFSKFQMAQFLGLINARTRVIGIGTPYSYDGPVWKISELRDSLGVPVYHTSIQPWKDDKGNYVLMTPEIAKKYEGLDNRRAQMDCDPRPTAGQDFRSDDIQEVLKAPQGLYTIMIVDPGGTSEKADADYTCKMVLGIEKERDEYGFCNVHILDLELDRIKEQYLPDSVVKMYVRHPDIQALCIEQTNVGLLKHWVSAILKEKHGITISEEYKTLIVLKPQGLGDKETRIRRALSVPFNRKKVYMLYTIPHHYKAIFKMQIDQFPTGAHDDSIDCLSWYPHALNTLNFEYLLDISAKKRVDLSRYINKVKNEKASFMST